MLKLTRLPLALLLAVFASAQTPSPLNLAAQNAANPASNVVAPGSFVSMSRPLLDFSVQWSDQIVFELKTADQVFPLQPLPPGSQDGRFSLWVLIPTDAHPGLAFITMIEAGVRGGTAQIVIEPVAPGLFTRDYAASGPALALNYVTDTPTLNALTSAAVPEHFVALFATGLNDATASDVEVEVAGQTVSASYAGGQSTPGLDQINFVLPRDVYQGCYVPVRIRVRGIASNQATLSISSDTRVCAHPLGLSYSDLVELDNGGTIPLARIMINTIAPQDSTVTERAFVVFQQVNATAIARYSEPQMPDAQYFSCTTGLAAGVFGRAFAVDAGPAITLEGPPGKRVEIPSPYYSMQLPVSPERFFAPGTWNVSAPGGADIPPFSYSFRLPPGISSINLRPFATISSEREIEVTWDPAGFGATDVVTVTISGTACRAPALAGRVVLPGAVRSETPQTVQVSVGPHRAFRPVFTVPLQDGTALRVMLSYDFWFGVPVIVQ